MPLAKIKNITKLDPEIKLCQKNAFIVIGKLTELFILQLAKESVSVAKTKKKKTLNLEDICKYILKIVRYFLIYKKGFKILINLACALKCSERLNFIDLNSIFSYETIEDLKIKEEKCEKKIKKSEKLNYANITDDNNTNEIINKRKITNLNKHKSSLKKAEGNMKIDSIFSSSNI